MKFYIVLASLCATIFLTATAHATSQKCDPSNPTANASFEAQADCKDPKYINVCYFSFNNGKESQILSGFFNKIQKLAKTDPKKTLRVLEFLPEKNDADEAFRNMINSGVTCNALVISGHHTGSWGGQGANGSLKLLSIENYSCRAENQEFFQRLRYVWLQGCRTLGQERGLEAGQDLVTFNAQRVARDLDLDGLTAANQATLQRDYADVFDRENPYSSRLNRTFEHAHVFGWTMTAPGVKAGSEYSALQHIANSLLNDEAKRNIHRPLNPPTQLESADSAQRYYNHLVELLSGPAPCHGCMTTGWIQHGNKSKHKGRFGVDNSDLAFLTPLKHSQDPLVKQSRSLDCKIRHSSSVEELTTSLTTALSNPRLAALALNSIRDITSQYSGSVREAWIKKLLRSSTGLKSLLFLKITSPNIGVLRKLEYYAFYREVTGERLAAIEDEITSKAVVFLKNITDANANRAYESRLAALSGLGELGLVNGELIAKLLKETDATIAEVGLRYGLQSLAPAQLKAIRQDISTAILRNYRFETEGSLIDEVSRINKQIPGFFAEETVLALFHQRVTKYSGSDGKNKEAESQREQVFNKLIYLIHRSRLPLEQRLATYPKLLQSQTIERQAEVFLATINALNERKEFNAKTLEAIGNVTPTAAVGRAVAQTEFSEAGSKIINSYVAARNIPIQIELEQAKDRSARYANFLMRGLKDPKEKFTALLSGFDRVVATKKLTDHEKYNVLSAIYSAVAGEYHKQFWAHAQNHLDAQSVLALILAIAQYHSDGPSVDLQARAVAHIDFNVLHSAEDKYPHHWIGRSFNRPETFKSIPRLMAFLESKWRGLSVQDQRNYRYFFESAVRSIVDTLVSTEKEQVSEPEFRSVANAIERYYVGSEVISTRTKLAIATYSLSGSKEIVEKYIIYLFQLPESDRDYRIYEFLSAVKSRKDLAENLFNRLADRILGIPNAKYSIHGLLAIAPTMEHINRLASALKESNEFSVVAAQTVCDNQKFKSNCLAFLGHAISKFNTKRFEKSQIDTLMITLVRAELKLGELDTALSSMNVGSEHNAKLFVKALIDREYAYYNRERGEHVFKTLIVRIEANSTQGALLRLANEKDIDRAKALLPKIFQMAENDLASNKSDVEGALGTYLAAINEMPCAPCAVEILNWAVEKIRIRAERGDFDKGNLEKVIQMIDRIVKDEHVKFKMFGDMARLLDQIHRHFDGPELSKITSDLFVLLISKTAGGNQVNSETLSIFNELRTIAMKQASGDGNSLCALAIGSLRHSSLDSKAPGYINKTFDMIWELKGGSDKQVHLGAKETVDCLSRMLVYEPKWTPSMQTLARLNEALPNLGDDGIQEYLTVLAVLPPDEASPWIEKVWNYFVETGAVPRKRLVSKMLLSVVPVSNREQQLRMMLNLVHGAYSTNRMPSLYGFERHADPFGLIEDFHPLSAAVRKYGMNGYLKDEIREELGKILEGKAASGSGSLLLAIALSPDSWSERKEWLLKLFPAFRKNSEPDLNLTQGLLAQMKDNELVLYLNLCMRTAHYSRRNDEMEILEAIEKAKLSKSEKAELLRTWEKLF